MSRNPYIQQRFGGLVHHVVDKENILRDTHQCYGEPRQRPGLTDTLSDNDEEYDASIGYARFPSSSYRVSKVFKPSTDATLSVYSTPSSHRSGVTGAASSVAVDAMMTPSRAAPSCTRQTRTHSEHIYSRQNDDNMSRSNSIRHDHHSAEHNISLMSTRNALGLDDGIDGGFCDVNASRVAGTAEHGTSEVLGKHDRSTCNGFASNHTGKDKEKKEPEDVCAVAECAIGAQRGEGVDSEDADEKRVQVTHTCVTDADGTTRMHSGAGLEFATRRGSTVQPSTYFLADGERWSRLNSTYHVHAKDGTGDQDVSLHSSHYPRGCEGDLLLPTWSTGVAMLSCSSSSAGAHVTTRLPVPEAETEETDTKLMPTNTSCVSLSTSCTDASMHIPTLSPVTSVTSHRPGDGRIVAEDIAEAHQLTREPARLTANSAGSSHAPVSMIVKDFGETISHAVLGKSALSGFGSGAIETSRISAPSVSSLLSSPAFAAREGNPSGCSVTPASFTAHTARYVVLTYTRQPAAVLARRLQHRRCGVPSMLASRENADESVGLPSAAAGSAPSPIPSVSATAQLVSSISNALQDDDDNDSDSDRAEDGNESLPCSSAPVRQERRTACVCDIKGNVGSSKLFVAHSANAPKSDAHNVASESAAVSADVLNVLLDKLASFLRSQASGSAHAKPDAGTTRMPNDDSITTATVETAIITSAARSEATEHASAETLSRSPQTTTTTNDRANATLPVSAPEQCAKQSEKTPSEMTCMKAKTSVPARVSFGGARTTAVAVVAAPVQGVSDETDCRSQTGDECSAAGRKTETTPTIARTLSLNAPGRTGVSQSYPRRAGIDGERGPGDNYPNPVTQAPAQAHLSPRGILVRSAHRIVPSRTQTGEPDSPKQADRRDVGVVHATQPATTTSATIAPMSHSRGDVSSRGSTDVFTINSKANNTQSFVSVPTPRLLAGRLPAPHLPLQMSAKPEAYTRTHKSKGHLLLSQQQQQRHGGGSIGLTQARNEQCTTAFTRTTAAPAGPMGALSVLNSPHKLAVLGLRTGRSCGSATEVTTSTADLARVGTELLCSSVDEGALTRLQPSHRRASLPHRASSICSTSSARHRSSEHYVSNKNSNTIRHAEQPPVAAAGDAGAQQQAPLSQRYRRIPSYAQPTESWLSKGMIGDMSKLPSAEAETANDLCGNKEDVVTDSIP